MSGRDIGGAKSCGCDTTINHSCDRHTIDRLEREVAEQGRRLGEIEFEARLGYMHYSAPAREGFRRIMDIAKAQ